MVITDIETTGTDPHKNGIASIGAVEFVNPKNTFYKEIKIEEDIEIDPSSLKITGFSVKGLRDLDKPNLDSVLREFANWFQNCSSKILTGHNVWFDKNFLDHSYDKIGLQVPYQRRTIDLHTLAFKHFIDHQHRVPMSDGHSKLDSDHIFKYIGIEDKRSFHNALEDAKLTAEAISRVLHDEKLLDEYKEYPIPWK